jgi:phosphocarrier protein FPr
MELQANNVQLQAHARDKEDAIRQAGLLLVEGGFIEPGYVRSMLGREQQANTYLGNGIAIPHGMPADRDLIRRTGISVVQLPDGVEWNPGERVQLVVGIAARSDEHLRILANLTDVLDDPETARRLASTTDRTELVAALNRARDHDGAVGAVATPSLAEARHVDVTLPPGLGLHARPATFFVEVASRFASDVQVEHNGKVANGKALASLLKLGVEGGSPLRILARGADEEEALRALRQAVEDGLGETAETETLVETYAWTPVSAGWRSDPCTSSRRRGSSSPTPRRRIAPPSSSLSSKPSRPRGSSWTRCTRTSRSGRARTRPRSFARTRRYWTTPTC